MTATKTGIFNLARKEEGPFQVARIGLHVKLEMIVLQADRGTWTTQGSTHAQKLNKCNKAEKLAEILSTWALNSYWVVQYYRDPRARHYD